MAVPHDDLLRDNSGAIIQRDREALMQADGGHELGQRALQSSGVKHRVDRRQGQGGPVMRANHLNPETKWLEELSVAEINQLIDSRKQDVIDKHISKGTRANRITAMSQYVEYAEIRGVAPIMTAGVTRDMSRIEVRENEDKLIGFAIYESWRVTPQVVGQYVSHVVNWHIAELGVDVKDGKKLLRLSMVPKGIKKLIPHERRIRLGLKPQQLIRMLQILVKKLKTSGHTIESRFAYRFILFLTWCFQGLYRGGEGARGVKFDATKHLSCADPRISADKKTVLVHNPELKVRNRFTAAPLPFPVDSGDICSFGHWVSLQTNYDPLEHGERANRTPLFYNSRQGGHGMHAACLSYDDALVEFRKLLNQACPEADVKLYGLHSMRIGAATSLFALGCPPLVIQTLGRWSSELYELYCRANREQLTSWTAAMSKAEFDTLEEMSL